MVRSLDFFGHAVPANELSTLRPDDPIQRLPQFEATDQTLKGEFAAHKERVERLLWFGAEFLERHLVRLRTGRT